MTEVAAPTADQPTRYLGRYISSNHDVDLPGDLVEWMKLLVLDTIGCGLFASHFPWTERLFDTVAATEGPGPSLVWGHDRSFSPASAAMVNGTAVHGFEIDDVGVKGHWGSVTVTSALALAGAGAPLSGLDLLRSMVTGIEVGARVHSCVGDFMQVDCGFHGPGVLGTFAAAASAAHVLELGEEESVNALSNAAQLVGGLMGTHHGGMGKRLLMGRAAQSGTFAAQLAAHGFVNVDNIFECGYGSFPAAFSGGRDTFRLAELTRGLGTDFCSYGVSFKLWACREPIHPALEAVKLMRQHRSLEPETISSVDVALPEGSYKAVGSPYYPGTVAAAQLNLQFCLATMLLYNEVFVDNFSEEQMSSLEVLDMVSRIHVRHDPEQDNNPDGKMARRSVVQVSLIDGERVEQEGTLRGPRDNPVTEAEVVAKFRRLTDRCITKEIQDELIARCCRLDTSVDARELLECVRFTRPIDSSDQD